MDRSVLARTIVRFKQVQEQDLPSVRAETHDDRVAKPIFDAPTTISNERSNKRSRTLITDPVQDTELPLT
jgi:hypothetical protein